MNKRLLGSLSFGLLFAGALTVGGIASCDNKDNNKPNPDDDLKTGCTTKLDCAPGQECINGACETVKGCDPAIADSCPTGEFCNDLGECVSCGETAKSCKIVGMNGQMNTALAAKAGSEIDLKAVALDANNNPIYCAAFDYSDGTNSAVDGKYTAVAGATKLTATVKGSNVSCEIPLNVFEAAEEGNVNVYAYDDNTGAPISDAVVVVNYDGSSDELSAKTNDKGMAVVADAFKDDGFTVTVFKDGYIYTTFADVKTADVAIPVGARPNEGVKVGGVKGKFSFDKYAEQFLQPSQTDFRLAAMLNSIPLSSIFSFDVANFVDLKAMPSMDTCKTAPDTEGCYSLDGVIGGLKTMLSGIGNIPTDLPLPGLVVVAGKSGEMKGSYDTPAVPGERIPWGVGLEFGLTEALPLVNFAMNIVQSNNIMAALNKETITEAVDTVLPFLLGKLGSAIGTPVSLKAANSKADYVNQDAALDEKMRVYREVKVESLPEKMDAMAALRVSNAEGYGAIITGLSIAADLDGNGKFDSRAICKDTDCPRDIPEKVAEGNIGMLYAPARGALTNTDDMTIYMTASIGDAFENGIKDPTNYKYGDLRLLGTIKAGEPKNSDVIKSSDFIGTPTTDETMVDMDTREYNFQKAAGADMNIIMLSADVEGKPVSKRWMVYSSGNNVKLPNVPDNMGDTIGRGSTNNTLVHISAKLKDGNSFDKLVENNGKNIERTFENLSALSVFIKDVDSLSNNGLR